MYIRLGQVLALGWPGVLHLHGQGHQGAPGGRALTEEIGRPAYRRIAQELREQIATGQLQVGSPIPSTSQLAQQHGVSITVVRAAIRELREEGLTVGQPGKAVYVRATPEHVATERATLDDVAAEVKELRAEMADVSERLAPDEVADLRTEVAELRRQLGVVHTQLIDLYSQVGQPYPREEQQRDGTRSPSKPSTRRQRPGQEATG
jgi:DNA-binding transcriptional regulator YhcF (GntR family)